MSGLRRATASTWRGSPSSSRAWPPNGRTRRRRSKSRWCRCWERKPCAMSQESDLRLPDAGSLQRGRFQYFPVAPGRLEFSIEVRRAILRDRPQVVAVELPVTLQPAWLRAVARLPEISLIFYPDESAGGDRAVYVPIEPADPFTEAIRTGLETGAEIVFADPDAGERPHLQDAYPDSYAIRHIGLDRYVEAYRVYPQPRLAELARHAAGIAWKLQGTDPSARVLVVISLNLLDPVLDAMEEPQAQPLARTHRDGIELLNAHPESLGEVCAEYPQLQWRYEAYRPLLADDKLIDRRHAQLAVLREAEKDYEANTGERIAHWQRRLLARYSRNLALAGSDLSPGLFDLAVAARGVADDNYAWEVWEAASRYPPQQTACDLMTVRIAGDEVWMDTRRIRLRRRLPSTKRRLRPIGLKARKKEKIPGEWASQLNGTSICSYPPEGGHSPPRSRPSDLQNQSYPDIGMNRSAWTPAAGLEPCLTSKHPRHQCCLSAAQRTRPAPHVHPKTPSVAMHRDQPIQVGAQHARLPLFVALQHLGVRVPVGVLEARGHHRERRPQQIQKRGRAGRLAAVVRHLEHVRLAHQAFGDQLRFDLPLDIAAQQERMASEGDAEG